MSEENGKENVPPNTVFIGIKPITGYAMSAMTLFQTNNEVVLKARGRAISHAVDVAEVLRNRFLSGKCEIASIKTATESVVTREGRKSNISAIEIVLRKI